MNQNKLLSSLYSAPPGLSRVHKGEKTSCTHPTGCKPGGLRQEGASQTYKGSHTVPRGTLGTNRVLTGEVLLKAKGTSSLKRTDPQMT